MRSMGRTLYLKVADIEQTQARRARQQARQMTDMTIKDELIKEMLAEVMPVHNPEQAYQYLTDIDESANDQSDSTKIIW